MSFILSSLIILDSFLHYQECLFSPKIGRNQGDPELHGSGQELEALLHQPSFHETSAGNGHK